MPKSFIRFFLVVFVCLAGSPDRLTAFPDGDHYLPGRLVVKLAPYAENLNFLKTGKHQTDSADTLYGLNALLETIDVSSVASVFGPGAQSKTEGLKRTSPQISGKATELAGALQRTYVINYRSGENPEQVAAEFENFGGVEYAEPWFIYEAAERNETQDTYIPNDPMIGREGHDFFDYLNIFQAWGVNRGSPDVVIAIVDTGVYYDHPDLKDHLWRNDSTGLANDYFEEFEIENDTIGWNFWESGDIYRGEEPEQNADPSGNYSTHGTMVAGIAAAVTDNTRGIAGAGFRTRYMPVKTGGTRDYPKSMAYAIHGVLYAAINGADVINCSFSGSEKSGFAADVMQFAREMGSVVVAAMGNDGISTTGVYPASFDDVLAVGAVRDSFDDRISSFSNFGYKVDVFAVGQNVLSTSFEYEDSDRSWDTGYNFFSGTSVSTPLVSGLAGLLRAEYPEWPAERIASQIRGTARSIYHANPDQQYENKLGYGVIDAFAALTQDVPLISFTDVAFQTEQNGKIHVGESGRLTAELVHYGSPSPEVFFQLESLQPNITLHITEKSTSELRPGEQFNIDFHLTIEDDYPLDIVPRFRLTWSDGDLENPSYRGTQLLAYEELLYGTIENENFTISIPSDGTLGFMNPEDNTIGVGFMPAGYGNILSAAGFMVSGYRNGKQMIINQVRDSTDVTRHFQPVENFRFDDDHDFHNVQLGSTRFHSVNHPVARELEIELEAIAPSTRIEGRSSLFLNYHITNNSDHIYSQLYFGLFNHWEIREEGMHHINFSGENNLMHISHEGGPPVAGIATGGVISSALAVDNQSTITLERAESRDDSLGFGTVYDGEDELRDGFTDVEKFLALSGGTDHAALSAEDVSMVIGTGPYTLHPHSSITIGFVYASEHDVHRLKNEMALALEQEYLRHNETGEYAKTGRVADELTLYANYPNPFNDRTNLRFDLDEPMHVELIVYDLMGRRVATLVDEVKDQGPHFVTFDGTRLASGTYMAVLRTNGSVKSDMMMLVK